MFIVLTELFVSAAFVTSAALAQTTPTTITFTSERSKRDFPHFAA